MKAPNTLMVLAALRAAAHQHVGQAESHSVERPPLSPRFFISTDFGVAEPSGHGGTVRTRLPLERVLQHELSESLPRVQVLRVEPRAVCLERRLHDGCIPE